MKFSELSEGAILSEQQFYKVVKTTSDRVHLLNEHGDNITVDAAYVEKCLNSASSYSKTVTLSRTEALSTFLSSTGVAMTVNFNKQPKHDDITDQIMLAFKSRDSKAVIRSSVEDVLKRTLIGEERAMVGRHYGHHNEFGRINFIDMEVEKDPAKKTDNRLRQVDPRTINWFIVRDTRYIVK